jgi:membrane-associated phospholipid phosphatase
MKILSLFLLLTFAVTANGITADSLVAPAHHQGTTPFTLARTTDIPLFCVGIVSATTGFAIEQSEKPLTQQQINDLSRSSVNWFDRSATYCYSKTIDEISAILVDLSIAAPLGLLADGKIRETIKTFFVMYAEVEMFSYVLPCIGKAFFKRPRPYNYNPAVPFDAKQSYDSQASFFSRHTTHAFASMCFISTMYGAYHPESELKPYIWAGSLAVASTVGYMRYRAGAHFPSDIAVGALAGTLVGCGVPWLHKSKSSPVHVQVDPFNNGLDLSIDW